ncbi:reverse transcriptase family protein [Stenotrophomonas sp. AS2]
MEELLKWSSAMKFRLKTVLKSDGGLREVYIPHWRLRLILRRINKRILADPATIVWPDYLFGSIPGKFAAEQGLIGRDYIACAARHCRAKSVLKVDVANFFGSITEYQVYEIYRKFLKFGRGPSLALAKLCCLDGFLVQGAPTSSYIANLIFWKDEHRLVGRLLRKGLTYTRYVDDITVSSSLFSQDYNLALRHIDDLLTSRDLSRSERKTAILRSGIKPVLVHGLRVEYEKPRIPRDELCRIRSSVDTLENFSTESNFRTRRKFRKMFNKCMGRVNKLSRVNEIQHRKLVSRLRRIQPLPHPKDVGDCRQWANRLVKSYPTKNGQYFFMKSCFRLRERLNLVARTFRHEAKEIRKMVSFIPNSYE